MPAPTDSTELVFPLGGVNVVTEFSTQPAGTTPVGRNVRGQDPLATRTRGGSRPGLTRYIADQVSGKNPIQLLAVVVDPTTAALLADFSADPADAGTGTPDPTEAARNPFGREVRTGGSGVAPSKNKKLSRGTDAVDDSLTVTVGDGATDVNVLANDSYAGTPTVTIVSGPASGYGSAIVTGSGAASRIRYTPPASDPGGASAAVVYRLAATGNTGTSTATLRITVNSSTPDPHVGGTYTMTGWVADTVDGSFANRVSGTMQTWNGGTNVAVALFFNDDEEVDGPSSADHQPSIVISLGESDALLLGGSGAGPLTISFTGTDGFGNLTGSITGA